MQCREQTLPHLHPAETPIAFCDGTPYTVWLDGPLHIDESDAVPNAAYQSVSAECSVMGLLANSTNDAPSCPCVIIDRLLKYFTTHLIHFIINAPIPVHILLLAGPDLVGVQPFTQAQSQSDYQAAVWSCNHC
jgi:hypothetical protein